MMNVKEISIYVTSNIPKLPKLGKLEPLVRSYPEELTNRTGVININFPASQENSVDEGSSSCLYPMPKLNQINETNPTLICTTIFTSSQKQGLITVGITCRNDLAPDINTNENVILNLAATYSGLPVKKIVFTEIQISKLYFYWTLFLETKSDYAIHNARRLKPQYNQVI